MNAMITMMKSGEPQTTSRVTTEMTKYFLKPTSEFNGKDWTQFLQNHYAVTGNELERRAYLRSAYQNTLCVLEAKHIAASLNNITTFFAKRQQDPIGYDCSDSNATTTFRILQYIDHELMTGTTTRLTKFVLVCCLKNVEGPRTDDSVKKTAVTVLDFASRMSSAKLRT